MKPDVWAQLLQARMSQVTDLHQLAEEGLELLEGEPPELRQRIQDMHDLYSYVETELPDPDRTLGTEEGFRQILKIRDCGRS